MHDFRDEIITAKECPYCGSIPELTDSSIVYGKSYGMIYLCDPCKAYVGVHKGTTNALGRLANKELREAKKEAHKYFDNLWKRAAKLKGRSKQEARPKAYRWLSIQLWLNLEHCHIGMFDIELCKRTIEVCKPYYKKHG